MARANQSNQRGTELAPPPPPKSLDSIDLEALKGHIIAIRCLDRVMKETKFGNRPMTTVDIVTPDSSEPLVGVLFSSYFAELNLYQWFIGKVALVRRGKMDAWTLEPITDKKATAALSAIVGGLPVIDGTEGL